MINSVKSSAAGCGEGSRRVALRVSVLYAVVGASWILISDWLLATTLRSEAELVLPHTTKGLVFIGCTAIVLYAFVRRQVRVLEQEQGERRASENKAQERAEHLSAAVQAANVGIWDWDLKTGRVFRSPEWKRQLGCEDEEVSESYDEFEKRIHPDDRERICTMAAEYLKNPVGRYEAEFRLRHRDGSYRWILTQASLVRDETGHPARFVGAHVDITDRKRDELEKARLIQVVEQATDSVVITDTEGTIVYVNRAFEQVSGYRREEAVGKNPRILKSGMHTREFYKEMWDTLVRGEVWRGSLVTRRKDGSFVDEVAAISAIRDGSGATVSYAAVKRDVTRERKLEKQLLQSQKLESIGRLAGGVAHDFNNLLTVIQGNAAMMTMKGTEGADVKLHAQEIVDAADRAARLTRQLLTFSRQQIMQQEALDLGETVTRMTDMLTRLLGETITLKTRVDGDAPHVLADRSMVDQVVLNLAVNARDAMPGGGELTVSVIKATFSKADAEQNLECSPGLYACLSVTDSGEGIDPSIQSRIFEPFFTTKEVGKGTGLGLSTVHGIVKQHRGWIDVMSERGKGTTFRVYLPAAQERATLRSS